MGDYALLFSLVVLNGCHLRLEIPVLPSLQLFNTQLVGAKVPHKYHVTVLGLPKLVILCGAALCSLDKGKIHFLVFPIWSFCVFLCLCCGFSFFVCVFGFVCFSYYSAWPLTNYEGFFACQIITVTVTLIKCFLGQNETEKLCLKAVTTKNF